MANAYNSGGNNGKWLRRVGWMAAGICLYNVGSCMRQPEHRTFERSGEVFVEFNGQRHQLYGNQMGTVDHRVRGLLDESPRAVRTAIEEVLYE